MQDKQQDLIKAIDAIRKLGQDELAGQIQSQIRELEHHLERKEDHVLKLNRELKNLNNSLKQMEEIRNEFVGICAHDLRSPIIGILNFLEILKLDGKTLPGKEVADIYKRMENAGKHMLELINDLLDLGNMESGKINLILEPIFLSHSCKEAIAHAKARLESKEIIPTLKVGTGELRVKLDPQKALQIINNLLSNAIKFTPRGGHIELNISTNERYMRLEIKDSGQGIPPNELDVIFERFQKTSTQATEGEKGSGLGLSIVHQLVELHQGNIEVKSKVGQGTSFTLIFPVAESKKLVDLFSGKK